MMQYIYLGKMPYDESLKLQAEMIALRAAGLVDNVLLLLEHPPVLTLGRNATRANILVTDELLAQRGVTVHEINRGGDVTFHGPGQLVGYPIFDLRTFHHLKGARFGPVDFVRMMEEALIRLCGVYGVRAGRIAGLTGVWCPDGGVLDESGGAEGGRKIGAIGIHVSRGITSHGFAFNVTTDLDFFRLINPCGITDKPVTSLARELPAGKQIPELEAVAHQSARQFGQVFGEQVLAVASLDDLRAEAAERAARAESQPAQIGNDTPLQIPREVERLHDPREHPVRA